MKEKNKAPDAIREGEVLIAFEKQARRQQALRRLAISLCSTMAHGIDGLESRIEKRLDRIEEKIDALLEQPR